MGMTREIYNALRSGRPCGGVPGRVDDALQRACGLHAERRCPAADLAGNWAASRDRRNQASAALPDPPLTCAGFPGSQRPSTYAQIGARWGGGRGRSDGDLGRSSGPPATPLDASFSLNSLRTKSCSSALDRACDGHSNAPLEPRRGAGLPEIWALEKAGPPQRPRSQPVGLKVHYCKLQRLLQACCS